jgi:hypothetical protein
MLDFEMSNLLEGTSVPAFVVTEGELCSGYKAT